jgi:hypothetical protein
MSPKISVHCVRETALRRNYPLAPNPAVHADAAEPRGSGQRPFVAAEAKDRRLLLSKIFGIEAATTGCP